MLFYFIGFFVYLPRCGKLIYFGAKCRNSVGLFWTKSGHV